MIDPTSGRLLTLAAARKQFPGRPSLCTLWRWRTHGVLAGRRRIRLECCRVGRQWFTTRDAIAEFVAAQTAASLPADDDSQPASDERSPVTERRLQAAGLL